MIAIVQTLENSCTLIMALNTIVSAAGKEQQEEARLPVSETLESSSKRKRADLPNLNASPLTLPQEGQCLVRLMTVLKTAAVQQIQQQEVLLHLALLLRTFRCFYELLKDRVLAQ